MSRLLRFFVGLFNRLRGRRLPQALVEIDPAIARDMGIKIHRIRLPSGAEIVIIEKTDGAD